MKNQGKIILHSFIIFLHLDFILFFQITKENDLAKKKKNHPKKYESTRSKTTNA